MDNEAEVPELKPKCFLVEHLIPGGGTWMEVFTQEENARGYAKHRETELRVKATVTPLFVRAGGSQPPATEVRRQALEEAAKACDIRASRHLGEVAAAYTAQGKSNFNIQRYEAEECASTIRALASSTPKDDIDAK